MKILLALDGSEFTDKVVDYLIAHRDVFGGAPELVCIFVNTPLPPHVVRSLGQHAADDYYADEAKKATEKSIARLAEADITAQRELRVGNAADEIAKLGKAGGFDMIIMGSHGRAALSSLVVGSAVTRVLGACGVPVLVIR